MYSFNWRRASAGATAIVALAASAAVAQNWSEWSEPVNAQDLDGSSSLINTQYNDGCPIVSPYDGSLYMASNRPGGHGDLDIWIAPKNGDGWGDPVNAGPTINTPAQEFCPSPSRGNRFYFVRRVGPTDTDIYVVKKLPKGWGPAERLPKGPGLINTNFEEWSPSWFEAPDGREFLYFSSSREHPQATPPSPQPQDIFYSVDLGPAQFAPGGVNSPTSNDNRPNVRRNGLEIVWDSNRTGSIGATDIWTANRSTVDEQWVNARRLPAGINSASGESRPSISWDGSMLLFGSTRPGEGSADIYVSTRSKQ